MPSLFSSCLPVFTGIMLSTAPWNWQLHNSYFVVAHFHYVLVGAIVFCFLGAFYYWYPKMTGRMLNERLGKWHFWLLVLGFHMTFDFMHIPGLLGMPRSIYTYEPGRGWDSWNISCPSEASSRESATLIFVYNLVISYYKGERPGMIPGTRGRWSGPRPRLRPIQLRQRPRVAQPQTSVGLEASGRSGFPSIRMASLPEIEDERRHHSPGLTGHPRRLAALSRHRGAC